MKGPITTVAHSCLCTLDSTKCAAVMNMHIRVSSVERFGFSENIFLFSFTLQSDYAFSGKPNRSTDDVCICMLVLTAHLVLQ